MKKVVLIVFVIDLIFLGIISGFLVGFDFNKKHYKIISFENADSTEKEKFFMDVDYNPEYIKNINNKKIYNKDILNKYKFVFMSDLHLSNANENEENEKIRESLIDRNNFFYGDSDSTIAKNTFSEIINYSNNINATALLLGGDIIDSPADSSLAIFKENINNLKIDYLYTFGNHDWSFAWDYHTENARKTNYPKFQEIIKDTEVSYLEYEDLIVLAINSSDNQIECENLEKIKNVLEKKKPTIVMMHVPISTTQIANDSLKYRDRVSAVGEGGVEPNEKTKEFFDILFSEKYKVFYILAGHVHIKMETDLKNNIHEYITEPAFSGTINLININ